MKRRTIIYAIAASLIIAYIAVVIPITLRAERNDTFTGMTITINDSRKTGFVKPDDIRQIVSILTGDIDTLRRKNLNTLELERLLNSNNRVESSQCRILNDGTLAIIIDPINPVARVFDRDGSVYVNAEGKRVPAMPSFHIDVPVVTTNATADSAMIRKMLPLLRAIKNDPRADALVSSLRIDGRGDIIIIPNVVGHVINFGDTSLIENKFERLRTFYKKVMPVRGWDAFDTISIKWAGRVVATKRDKEVSGRLNLSDLVDIVDEVPDKETMADN